MRGWELRGWLSEAIHCAQNFSGVPDISRYADGAVLTVHMLRRGIADPTGSDLQQATDALRSSDRVGLWAILSRGVHMRVLMPEFPGGSGRVSPLVTAIQGRYQEDPDQE